MKNFDNDNAKIETEYITFQFHWSWIRDKQMVHKGDKDYGMLWILDGEGQAVKAFGYELISKEN
jgi:hypothetical protein